VRDHVRKKELDFYLKRSRILGLQMNSSLFGGHLKYFILTSRKKKAKSQKCRYNPGSLVPKKVLLQGRRRN
jgi:hypothetical protein